MAAIKRSQYYSPLAKQATLFADISSGFMIHPNKLDLTLDTNTEAVTTSIKNLLLTNRGERFFNPSIGSKLNALLFENFTVFTRNDIIATVEDTIKNYEPRAKLINTNVSYLPDDDAVQISITFSTINNAIPTTIEIFLNRAR